MSVTDIEVDHAPASGVARCSSPSCAATAAVVGRSAEFVVRIMHEVGWRFVPAEGGWVCPRCARETP